MKEALLSIRQEAVENIESAEDLESLEGLRVKYMGKKGELTTILRSMGKLSKEERPIMGKLANEIRDDINHALEDKKVYLERSAYEKQIEKEKIDVTITKPSLDRGHRHPLHQVMEELEDLFVSMGFSIVQGPEIETVENNFDN